MVRTAPNPSCLHARCVSNQILGDFLHAVSRLSRVSILDEDHKRGLHEHMVHVHILGGIRVLFRHVHRRLEQEMRKAVFLFSVLLASILTIPLIPHVYAIATYAYDAETLAITITGSTATFSGWWTADKAGGWGTIDRTSTNQYYLIANALAEVWIGDGSTTTLFFEISKQVNFGYVHWYIKNHATLHFGTLSVEATKQVMNPVQIINNGYLIGESGSILYLYGASIRSGYVISNSTNQVWGCHFSNLQLSLKDANMYNCILNSVFFNGVDYENSGAIDTVNQWGAYLAICGFAYNSTLININAIPSIHIIKTWYWTGTANLINVNSTNWSIDWHENDIGIIWRKYEFDLITTNGSNVEITYYGQGGGTLYNATLSGTTLATQTISKGFYNKANGNNIQSYEPFHLKISKNDYQTYETNFTLTEKTSWEISLQQETPAESEFPVGLGVGALLMGFVAVIALSIKKKR